MATEETGANGDDMKEDTVDAVAAGLASMGISGVRSSLLAALDQAERPYPEGHPLAGRPMPKPGFSFSQTNPAEYHLDEDTVQNTSEPHTWSQCDATSYRTRVGPNYPRNGKKDNSGRAIYSVYAVDCFHAPNKVPHIAEWMDIPQLDNTGLPVPPVIVVNFMLPCYEPTDGLLWGKKTTDGDGYQLVVYAAITDWAREAFQSGNPPNCLKLLQRFIEASQQPGWEDHALRKRFKVIAKFVNVKYISFGMVQRPLVKNYNAKPFIARDSSTMYTKPGHYFQVDVDIHAGFGLLARKQLWGIRDLIPEMIFDFGFVIEGTPDDELPEQMLCCARVSRIQFFPDAKSSQVKDFPYPTPKVKGKK